MLNQKALEAAVFAHDKEEAAMRGEPDPWADGHPEEEFSDRTFCMGLAINTYLSAITPEDVAGLVEQILMEAAASHAAGFAPAVRRCYQTIQLIQSQAARIAELEGVLSRVPGALNGAFLAGTQECEGGSARRQEKYAVEGDALRREISALMNKEPPHD